MTVDHFNEKWSDYLEEGHYGLAIDDPVVAEYLDKLFEDLTRLPGFSYSQIKWKFDNVCFYATGITGAMQRMIENTIKDKASYDLIEHLHSQKSWSGRTFGHTYQVNRLEGILKHIEQEVEEVREDLYSLEEWIDLVTLSLDGAWRTGATNVEVAHALRDKLLKNKSREWPDWRTIKGDEPSNHIKDNG